MEPGIAIGAYILPSRLTIAEPDIIAYFDGLTKNVFTYNEIGGIVDTKREVWRLAISMSIRKFVDHFIKRGKVREVKLEGDHVNTTRYTWVNASDYEIAVSIKKGSYLSHYSAVHIHALTDQIPKSMYVNFEQPIRPKPKGELIQENIDRAFKANVRVSNNIVNFNNARVVLLNGKNTGRLGVERTITDEGVLDVTDLERTLIDIAVRPVYSGGVYEVARAYSKAIGEISTNRLSAYLKIIDYVYPYNQVIGFYLEYAGFKSTLTDIFRDMGLIYDFYLTHGMKETEYIKDWRLYVPKDF